MTGHAVLPLEPLLADGALERLLVRVRQLVAVQVVDVTESFPTHVAAVVLLDGLRGLLDDTVLVLVLHGGHGARPCGGGGGGQDASHRGDVRVATVLS